MLNICWFRPSCLLEQTDCLPSTTAELLQNYCITTASQTEISHSFFVLINIFLHIRR